MILKEETKIIAEEFKLLNNECHINMIPYFLGLDTNKKQIAYPLDDEIEIEDNEKLLFFKFAGTMIKKADPNLKIIWFISEAWQSLNSGIRPSKDPQHTEIILILGVSLEDGKMIAVEFPVARNLENKMKFGKERIVIDFESGLGFAFLEGYKSA